MTSLQGLGGSRHAGLPDQYQGLVDNRCCICLTLRTGAILIGILNGAINVASFTAYVTSNTIQSSWSHPGEPVTNLDISYLVVFTLQIVCDAILIWGALKKVPKHLVPWLWANAVIIAVFLVFISLILFFGHWRSSVSEEEFISVLACIGILGGVHIFSWLTVFQFRKNLLEEQRLLERTVATAPLPNLDESSLQLPQRINERPPSPPPGYDEVTKQRPTSGISPAASADCKIDLGNEAPPEYDIAIAMSAATQQGAPSGAQAESKDSTTLVLEETTK